MAEMTREEAAKVLEMLSGDLLNIENADLINKILDAMSMAAAALRGWVKTADRLPTEPDDTPFIVYMEGWFENPYDAVRVWTAEEIRYIPEEVIAYMPLLPLPEVEE
jgi:hypothetical protein